ncbi:MAG: ParM/StbA family protein [Anaerolineales bacterium]|nr:ParM/StbA family protein [Anaerolineales bacterium]
MNNKTTHILGEDLGMGANKLYGAAGGLQVPSQVSLNGSQKVARMLGLRSQTPPLHITTEHGQFYVGAGAHDWGRPVENLDYDRLTGAPEMLALFYGSLTRYLKAHRQQMITLTLVVGMPLEPLTGDQAKVNVAAVRRWMSGEHHWEADGDRYQVAIETVKVTSQATGALFDHVLDEQGHFNPGGRVALKKEIGIISVGFNTVELLVVRDKKPVQRFTAGATAGVRRLLEIVNTGQMYSLGELDTLLRAGRLDIKEALPVWEREVTGVVERHWGQSWKRFASILLVGGGAVLLKDSLPYRFNGKAFVPNEPVLSVARGLYKLGLFQDHRKRR